MLGKGGNAMIEKSCDNCDSYNNFLMTPDGINCSECVNTENIPYWEPSYECLKSQFKQLEQAFYLACLDISADECIGIDTIRERYLELAKAELKSS
jgi:hypothetical protein